MTGEPPKAYMTAMLLPDTVAVPLNVPWKSTCELLFVTVIVAPVNAQFAVQLPRPGSDTDTLPSELLSGRR